MAKMKKAKIDEPTEKVIEKYSMCGDDSSDEEDSVIDYNGTKARQKLEQYNQKPQDSHFGHNNLSFIAHAVGIKFLYLSPIQGNYYKIKKKLKDSFLLPNKDELIRGIELAAEHVSSFQKQHTKESVKKSILGLIDQDIKAFWKAFACNKLSEFFEPLTSGEEKYNSGNLLGWLYEGELGKLKIILNDKARLPYDLSLSGSSNFSIEFFANLRLHNRLDKRLVKHKDDTTKQNSEWKYPNSTTVTIMHGITEEYREEEVKFGDLGTASYETIYSSALLSMKDLDELPEVFVNGTPQLSDNAASLHYLLFGTEVIRNPSALVHNMMMLDLIKCGKLTWKQAFMDKHMPMSIQGAIMASRIINSEYNDEYMPHKYLYEDKTYKEYATTWKDNWDQPNYKSSVDLLNREKELMIEWLKMKFGQDYLKFCLDEKGDLKIEHVESIFTLLEQECQRWYNIDTNAQMSDLTWSVALPTDYPEKDLSGASSNIQEDDLN